MEQNQQQFVNPDLCIFSAIPIQRKVTSTGLAISQEQAFVFFSPCIKGACKFFDKELNDCVFLLAMRKLYKESK
jgi:hypothetical protein